MLNKKTFADRINVRPLTITRWENCESEPTAENLDAIARVLMFPRSFFFGPDLDEPLHELTSFRSQESMTAATRDAALAAGTIGFRIMDWIGDRFDLPNQSLPDLRTFAEPEIAARALREEWALGEKPVSNMIQLLESKGVRVFSLSENTEKVNAYSLWRSDGTPYVFLNTFKSAECSRFDAAHELAHLVLHRDGSVTGRSAEDQANAFASAFLMPKSDLLAVLPRVMHLRHLINAKTRWRVSVAALTYRVHKLGIISDWKYRDLCIEISSNGYRKNEPSGIERERSMVWEKVIKTLWREKVTQEDIAAALDIPADEVSDLIFGMLDKPLPVMPTPPDKPLAVVKEEGLARQQA